MSHRHKFRLYAGNATKNRLCSAERASPRKLIAFLLMALCIAAVMSCGESDEPELSPEDRDRFTTIYADLLIAFELAGKDSSAYFPMRDSILRAYDVDTAWVNRRADALGESSQKWLDVWEEITRKLEARRDSLTP